MLNHQSCHLSNINNSCNSLNSHTTPVEEIVMDEMDGEEAVEISEAAVAVV